MNKQILYTIVLAFILSACTNSAPTPTIQPVGSTTPLPETKTSSPSADSSQNWKTYSSTDYSVQYPNGWTVEEGTNGLVEIFNPKTAVDAVGNGGGNHKIETEYVNITQVNSTQTVKQYVDEILKTNPAYINVSTDVLQREVIKINNVTAEIMNDNGQAAAAKILHVSNGKKMFILYTSDLDIHDLNKNEVKLINSLKFK